MGLNALPVVIHKGPKYGISRFLRYAMEKSQADIVPVLLFLHGLLNRAEFDGLCIDLGSALRAGSLVPHGTDLAKLRDKLMGT